MGNVGLPLDESGIISTSLEGILYGFSVFMFGVTMYTLTYNSVKLGRRLNHRMITVSCLLLAFSTAHMIIDIKRIMDGLVTQRDTFPGGPAAFFAQPGEITFVVKNIFYAAQTLTGDGVLIYRCYVVWQSRKIIIFPIMCWLCVLVCAIVGIWALTTVPIGDGGSVFLVRVGQWITAFYASTLGTNLLVSLLLAYKIWDADRRASAFRQSSMMPIVRVVMDAGALYSVTLLATLICFTQKSNGQYLLLDMITPIIAITFYMVIIRVGLAAQRQRSEQASSAASNNIHSSRHDGVQSLPMSRLQVHITKLRETDVDADVEAGVELDSRSDVERKASSFSNQVTYQNL